MRTAPTVRIDRSLRRSLALFASDRLRWLDEAAGLGPLAGLRFGRSTVWVLSDAEAARTMLVSDGDSWSRPPATRVPIRLGVGENLFTQPDKAWALLQPHIAPAFRKRALEARLDDVDELVNREVAVLPVGQAIDLGAAMGRITLMVAAWVLLGEELDRDRANELADHQRQIVTWVGHRLGKATAGIPIALGQDARAVRDHRRALEAYSDELIARARRGSHSETDVLGALIAARPAGKALRPDALCSHVLGLFFAGNETTAAALSWALVHGANNAAEWARLRTEPERVRAYIDETLRLTPSVWGFTRTPTRRRVTLEAGDETISVRWPEVVTIYLKAMNRRPQAWPHPHRFRPDRHLTTNQDPNRSLLPFGLGPRGCIGQHLAMAEMITAVPVLARHGDITIDSDAREDASFALRPGSALHGTFTPAATR
jgi:cytochrome P450